jgi:hypothetical protein
MWTDRNGKAIATSHNFAKKIFFFGGGATRMFLFEKAPACPVYQQMLNKNSQVL